MLGVLIGIVLTALGRALISLGILLPVLAPLVDSVLWRLYWYPSYVSFTATPSAILVAKSTRQGQNACWLEYGDPANRPGISFDAAADFPLNLPASFGGTLEFVQDVVPWRRRMPGDKDPTECLKGGRCLDTTDPYRQRHVVRGGRNWLRTDDSPANPLRHREKVEIDDHFRMFFMWRPERYGGLVRLPLAVLAWSWTAEADASARPGDCSEGLSAWTWISSASHHDESPAQPTSGLPVTSPNVTSLDWKKC